MTDIHIPGTRQTPTVDFRFSEHSLKLSGEAYPENAVTFFEPLNAAVEAYLAEGDAPVSVEFDLRYLNSAATKMIFKLGGVLNKAAERRKISLRFLVVEDDEMVQDLGADFKADFSWIDFQFVEMAL